MSFLSRIKAAFRRSPASRPKFAGVERILAAESPFGVEVWDCRPFTHHMISTTASPEVAQRFVQLRSSLGAEYRHQTFDEPAVPCSLTYHYPQRPSDGPLFKAEEMEDKWDIYLFDDTLYFARSWTGDLAYRANVRYQAGRMEITGIAVTAAHDPALARRAVDFLVKSHLLRREAPHPLPAELPPTPEQIAAFSFSMFGRRCDFGSYADTTAVPLHET